MKASGAKNRIRTCDLSRMKRMLYQLSYLGMYQLRYLLFLIGDTREARTLILALKGPFPNPVRRWCHMRSLLLRPHLFQSGLSPQATYCVISKSLTVQTASVVVERVNPCIRPLALIIVSIATTSLRCFQSTADQSQGFIVSLATGVLASSPESVLFVSGINGCGRLDSNQRPSAYEADELPSAPLRNIENSRLLAAHLFFPLLTTQVELLLFPKVGE